MYTENSRFGEARRTLICVSYSVSSNQENLSRSGRRVVQVAVEGEADLDRENESRNGDGGGFRQGSEFIVDGMELILKSFTRPASKDKMMGAAEAVRDGPTQ